MLYLYVWYRKAPNIFKYILFVQKLVEHHVISAKDIKKKYRLLQHSYFIHFKLFKTVNNLNNLV